MKLLDLFCKAGGAAVGYHRAGFDDITGIDIEPQPRYPFRFIQGDALEYLAAHGAEYDAIHASPPCQAYSQAQTLKNNLHPDLVGPTRELLNAISKPWVIENVEGAPLHANLMLCGSMFGLGYGDLVLMRHRYFESGGGWNLSPFTPYTCNHDGWAISVFGNSFLGGPKNGVSYNHPNGRIEMGVKVGRIAMGIDWMTGKELSEAIPPAYTEYVGRQLIAAMDR